MKVVNRRDDESYALDVVLVQLARWIKAHSGKYAPITAISKTADYRKMLRFLRRKGYIRLYKSGAVVIVEKKGWNYISMYFQVFYHE